jgi:sec-independent protein translocase protein TatB
MNLLGIGPFELLLILVIATIVLGPERMAQAGRTLGRLYAKYRFRWQRDVDEMTRELRRELAMLQKEMDEIRHAAESEIKTAQAALESAVDTQIDLDAVATKNDLPDTQEKTGATDTLPPAQPPQTTENKNETKEVQG